MTTLSPDLVRFWAKSPREPQTPRPYHPLICHMIDVSVVTQALWREVLPAATRRWVAASLGRTADETERWLCFLAGSHDIGKASPPFAFKDELLGQRILSAGFRPELPDKTPHGTVTAYTLREMLPADRFSVSQGVATRLACAIGGHHGIFPKDYGDGDLGVAALGQRPWQAARAALLDCLADLWELPADAAPRQLDDATAMWLAGLVSVADWIGSNTNYFSYAVHDDTTTVAIDLPDYATGAREKARGALTELGWSGGPATLAARPFDTLFSVDGEPMTPRPLQQAVIALAENLTEPSLVIVEAPMGEGKTEAAMYLADHNAVALGQRGQYFALPTQATSNQMFGRVKEFLEHRYTGAEAKTVNLQLLHGYAALSAQFEEMRIEGDRLLHLREVYGDDNDDRRAAVVAAEWFTHRKRGLLAPFGVGTVDQVLLAALGTKHVFVRLFGLARKTIIIDEVHAYDTYMTVLLERLLQWLGALGSSVVLLSATLPQARRQALLKAYLKGTGRLEAGLTDAAYPRVSWAGATEGAVHIATSARSTKTVRLAWVDGRLPEDDPVSFVLGKRLRFALDGGGCAAVICNTVGRAQQVYRALCHFFSPNAGDSQPELYLLHARYLFMERDRREKEVIRMFGKPGADTHRPQRAVLVATQIIEQSLDLDFDLLVTDFAPADLILQRIGRLHRHDRPDRLAAFTPPTAWICQPERMEEGLPSFDRGTEIVYDDHHVLLRSWLALKDRSAVSIPTEIEEVINAVYNDSACPEASSPALRARWDETLRQQQDGIAHDDAQARNRYIKRPGATGTGNLAVLVVDAREEEAPELHQAHQALTRLAEPSVSVICLYGTKGEAFLDAERRNRVWLDREPTMDLTRQLLQRSVTVSNRRVVFTLLEEAAPTTWQRSPLLRHCRLVTLDGQGGASIGGYWFELADDVGLVISKQEEVQ